MAGPIGSADCFEVTDENRGGGVALRDKARAHEENGKQYSCVLHEPTVKLEVDFKSRTKIMTIGELAEKSAVPASTIRFWERIGVLPKPVRISGQRRYSADAIHRLAVLRLAQACGFRLDEMRDLLHGFGAAKPPQRWQELARRKQQELDDQIARLKAMRRLVDRVMLCQCTELGECGRRAASVLGLAAQ
jgi:MerR family redox-sensitive transcriptional activator SoxR